MHSSRCMEFPGEKNLSSRRQQHYCCTATSMRPSRCAVLASPFSSRSWSSWGPSNGLPDDSR